MVEAQLTEVSAAQDWGSDQESNFKREELWLKVPISQFQRDGALTPRPAFYSVSRENAYSDRGKASELEVCMESPAIEFWFGWHSFK